MAKTITIETTAWLTDYGSPDALKSGESSLSGIGFALHDMTSFRWSKVGKATITIEVPDEQALIDNKIEALKAEKQKVIADAEIASRRIEQQIQSLLAITCEATK